MKNLLWIWWLACSLGAAVMAAVSTTIPNWLGYSAIFVAEFFYSRHLRLRLKGRR